MEIIPGPDFPTGGIICGRYGIRQGYKTGRSYDRPASSDDDRREQEQVADHHSEVPFQQFRDRVIEKIAELAQTGKIKGISTIRDEAT